MQHRPDIDGLRAIAVVPVILFHMELTPFSGGFVGVDVFFVISGFLITSIIARDLENKDRQFSLRDFYERRIRRIFPALFSVLAVTSALAYVVLLPRDLNDYAKSLVATAGFASNIFFYRQWGYFDAEAHTKPLLHTWSLAVEEQFYLVFPLLLVLLYGLLRRRKHVRQVLALLAFASFVWTVALLSSNQAAAFYLAPARSWELLLGSMLALGAVPAFRPRFAEYAALTGVVLLAVAVLAFTASTPFPGPAALLPCVGAALIIHAGEGTRIARLLSLRPIVFVGLISYSLYLWHWALLSLARHWVVGALSLVQTWMVIAVAVAFSAFSWKYIEGPFRGRAAPRLAEKTAVQRWRVFIWGGAFSMIAVILGVIGWRADGWPSRVPPEAIAFDASREDFNLRRKECHSHDGMSLAYRDTCRFGASDGEPRYAIWGDSHAAEMVIALGELAEAAGSSIRLISYTACPPGSVIAGGPRGDGSCALHEAATHHAIAADSSLAIVFLVARYSYAREVQGDVYFTELGRVARALADAGKIVVLIYPLPEYKVSVPMQLARAVKRGTPASEIGMSRSAFDAQRAPYVRALNAIRADARIQMVDPATRLCTKKRCIVYAEGHALYFDDDHLSVRGVRFLAPSFARFFGATPLVQTAEAAPFVNTSIVTPNRRR